MQYTIAIWLATLSAICAGQGVGLGDLPDCAKPCAATLPANCGLSVQCICNDKDWITGISCCVKGKCSESEQQKTIQVAQQICDTVKVTLPSAATCPGDAASTGASSGGSSTMSGSSTMAGSSTMTGSAMMGSSTMSGSKMSSTMGSTMGSTSSTAGAPATVASGGATSGGAGGQHVLPGVGAGAALLGLALL